MRRVSFSLVGSTMMLSACGLLVGVEPLQVVDSSAHEDAAADGGADAGADAKQEEDARSDDGSTPSPDAACPLIRVGPATPRLVTVGGAGNGWGSKDAVSVEDNAGATTNLCCSGGPVSQVLNARDFGFSVPTGARIQGVEVQTRARSSSAGFFVDNSVKITAPGGVLGAELKTTKAYGDAFELRDYGGATNTSGLALTPMSVNASDFGVAISVVMTPPNAGPFFELDVVRVTVVYCE